MSAAQPTPPPSDADAAPASAPGAVDACGPLERAIAPILHATGWRGDPAQIVEALPHMQPLASIDDLRIVLHHLGARSSIYRGPAEAIADDLLPALLVERDALLIALRRDENGLRLLDPETGAETTRRIIGEMRLCSVWMPIAAELPAQAGQRWFRDALNRLSPDLGYTLALSLVANVLAMAPPLFTIGVYNLALPVDSVTALMLAGAVAIGAVTLEFRMRRQRARVVARASARVNYAVASQGFARVLSFPMAMADRASVSKQLSLLRQFETIMAAFPGPVVAALLDLPFVIMMVIVIGLVAGPLVIPIALALLLMTIAALFLAPAVDRASRDAADTKSEAQALLREMLTSLATIRETGLAPVWRRRLRAAHRRAAGARVKSAILEGARQNACIFLMALCTIATIAGGAVMVMAGDLTVGALVGVTMLGARAFGPAQIIMMRAHAFSAARAAARRFEHLLDKEGARPLGKAPPVARSHTGQLRLREVTFRSPQSAALSLRAVDAALSPGSALGVTGASGAGQSELLKVAAGLYRPTAGAVTIDGVNLTQLHPAELRRAIAYVGAEAEFFYGTIAQNMRLADPTATDARIAEALELCGADDAFPEGLSTRLSAQGYQSLPAATRQRLALARAVVKQAPLTILDHPETYLSSGEDGVVATIVGKLKESGGVLLATRRPSVLKSCDYVLALDDGRAVGLKPIDAVFSAAKQRQAG